MYKKDATLSLKVMINKEENKVLFAEADSHFTDVLLSFLTLPLGRIIKILKNKYGDEAPTIGSLSSLYHGLQNVDAAHFWTEDAKETLLNPASSFEAEYGRLEVDISDSAPSKIFYCRRCPSNRFRSVSMYYDYLDTCTNCGHSSMSKKVAKKGSDAASSDGVLTMHKASFTISDDLQIFPNEMGLLRIIDILGITDTHKAEEIQVSLGFSEIVELLKASFISPTPLSDVILNKTTRVNYSALVECQPKVVKDEKSNSKNVRLKVMKQKSTGKLLYVQAKEDFIELLFGFLHIPLGGVVYLLGSKTCIKGINNMYRSTVEHIHKYFETPDTKNRLIIPNLPHGCVSENYILPLAEECLPANYTNNLSLFSSIKFPEGQGSYLVGPRTYNVTDDLTVTPLSNVSILSALNNLKISISDVQEMELQIGLKEALSILRASLTSTSALTDALLNHMSNKQPKTERSD